MITYFLIYKNYTFIQHISLNTNIGVNMFAQISNYSLLFTFWFEIINSSKKQILDIGTMFSKGISDSEANDLFSEFKTRTSERCFPSYFKYLCKMGIKTRETIFPLQNAWKSILEWESSTTFNKIQILVGTSRCSGNHMQ